MFRNGKSAVTLSGLLNVIDGVGSEEGKLFFATVRSNESREMVLPLFSLSQTNYVHRLDPALLRPGRIDMKIQYNLSTRQQASALFARFFIESRFSATTDSEKSLTGDDLSRLEKEFAALIPEDEFSTAELQGYLLTCKKDPVEAVAGVVAWIEKERAEKRDRAEHEKQRKEKHMESMAQRMPYTNPYPYYPPLNPAQAYPYVPSELPSTLVPTPPITDSEPTPAKGITELTTNDEPENLSPS